jgi:hypothetical protein
MLVHSFWHRDPDELASYRYGGHAYLWTQYMGRYKVQTWTNKDGRPVATGWFLKED